MLMASAKWHFIERIKFTNDGGKRWKLVNNNNISLSRVVRHCVAFFFSWMIKRRADPTSTTSVGNQINCCYCYYLNCRAERRKGKITTTGAFLVVYCLFIDFLPPSQSLRYSLYVLLNIWNSKKWRIGRVWLFKKSMGKQSHFTMMFHALFHRIDANKLKAFHIWIKIELEWVNEWTSTLWWNLE